MGTKPANSIRARKARVPKSTKHPSATPAEAAEAIHLTLVGVHAAAVIAARASDLDMEIHLRRHVVNPLALLTRRGGK